MRRGPRLAELGGTDRIRDGRTTDCPIRVGKERGEILLRLDIRLGPCRLDDGAFAQPAARAQMSPKAAKRARARVIRQPRARRRSYRARPRLPPVSPGARRRVRAWRLAGRIDGRTPDEIEHERERAIGRRVAVARQSSFAVGAKGNPGVVVQRDAQPPVSARLETVGFEQGQTRRSGKDVPARTTKAAPVAILTRPIVGGDCALRGAVASAMASSVTDRMAADLVGRWLVMRRSLVP